MIRDDNQSVILANNQPDIRSDNQPVILGNTFSKFQNLNRRSFYFQKKALKEQWLL